MRFGFYIIIFISGLVFGACSQRMVCPAYQSAFLLDDEARNARFSLFLEDSIPKEDLLVSKDKRGLMASVSYRGRSLKEKRRLKLVEAEAIYPAFDEGNLDSLVVINELDSLMEGGELPDYSRKPPGWPGFNRDQRVYEELYGDYLEAQPAAPEELKKKKCKFFQWFKKKDKNKEEEPEQEEPEQEEESPSEEETGDAYETETNRATN